MLLRFCFWVEEARCYTAKRLRLFYSLLRPTKIIAYFTQGGGAHLVLQGGGEGKGRRYQHGCTNNVRVLAVV
jgi:hypothetical protein